MNYSLSKTITVLGKVIVKPERSFSFLSYLLNGKKRVLIDTVPKRAATLFLEELQQNIALEELDAIILNHSEGDHSGGLELLLQSIPDIPIYCSKACQARLQDAFPTAHFCPVDNDSNLEIGDFHFHFIHTPGMHWNDNMVTYFTNEHILFSNDLFGQSLGASIPLESQFSKEVLLAATESYFEQVFSSSTPEQKQVLFKLVNLELSKIAPGHGVVLSLAVNDVLKIYQSLCQ